MIKKYFLSLVFLASVLTPVDVFAQDPNPAYDAAKPIQFESLDQLLWGVVKTLQYFSLPVMALSIAALGIALIASGDDTERKSRLCGWIFNILVGGLLVFGSASLAGVLKQFVGGTS